MGILKNLVPDWSVNVLGSMVSGISGTSLLQDVKSKTRSIIAEYFMRYLPVR
jgi:hypothetical protein